MKRLKKLSPFLIITLCYNAHAQVITDGSMGHKGIIPADNHHQITISQAMGTTAGNNLFHSFQSFNIDSNESVIFTGANNLQNVISRVTGGQLSQIDGLLKSNIAQANFYFFNPAGIVFGKHATINVPAALHINTSNSLNFKEGQAFLATLTASSLNIAQPIDFGFLNNLSGDIKILSDHNGYQGTDGSVRFTNKNDIFLSASNITLDHGSLFSNSGIISIIAKNNLTMNNSSINNGTYSQENAGKLSIKATNIELHNSIIASYADTHSTGNAGDIEINAENLTIEGDKAGIHSKAFSIGSTGDILINSDDIIVRNQGSIDTSTHDKGNAGTINIETHNLTLDRGYIYDYTVDSGNAGSISINSDKITLDNGGVINSSTYNQGKAGDINIVANSIAIHGHKQHTSQISAAAWNNNTINNQMTGQTGIINIIANNSLHLYEGGKISIENQHRLANYQLIDQAGAINITSPDIILGNNSIITAQSTDNMASGTMTISFAHWLSMNNHAAITTQANIGNGGDLFIKGGSLINMSNASHINTYTQQGTKNGNIYLHAESLIMNNAQIKTQTYANNASGGDIHLNLQSIVPSQNQLQIENKPMKGSDSSNSILNIINASGAGGVFLNVPLLNLSGNLGDLEYTGFEMPDLTKNSCDNALLRKNSLVHKGKGGLAFNEKKWVFVPVADLALNTQLQSVITPNQLANNSLIDNKKPCSIK